MAESSPVSTSQPLGSRSCGRAGLQGHVPDEEGALCRLGSLSTSAREDRTCAQTPSPTPPAARGRGRATLVGEQPFLADAPATWLSWPPSSPGLVGSQREDAGLCAVSTRAPLSPERTGGRRGQTQGGHERRVAQERWVSEAESTLGTGQRETGAVATTRKREEGKVFSLAARLPQR